MRLALPAAIFTSLTAWWAWVNYRLRYSPDFELYTQDWYGLYPSPLGRLLGGLGEEGFVGLSIVAAGVVVLLAWKGAGNLGVLAIVASPVLLYLDHAGIDPIALAFYTGALVGVAPLLLLPAAGLTHLSLMPFVGLAIVSSKRMALQTKLVLGFFLVPSVTFAVLATPYAGIVTALDPVAFLQGIGAGLLIGLPAILLFRFSLASCAGFLLGALECGFQQHLQARYLLPAVILHVIAGRPRRWALRLSEQCSRVRYVPSRRGAGGGARPPRTPTTTQEGLAP